MTVDLDTTQLQGALDKLLKAAGDTVLQKGDGVNIANSGTTIDGKSAGGGQGSMSDAGSLDDLMIAKMSASGIDAGTIAAFQAFMKKDEDEDEDDQDGSGTPPQPPFTQKSLQMGDLAKSISDDPVVSEAVEVSPFLEALVERTTHAVSSLEKSQHRFQRGQGTMNQALAKALVEIGQLCKSQQTVIAELGKRLNIVERAPVAAPKGRTTEAGARALTKSMPGEVGRPLPQLRKSEVLSTLSYMNLEKGLKTINGNRTVDLVGALEAGDVVDNATLQAVQMFLSNNPGEAEIARQYQ